MARLSRDARLALVAFVIVLLMLAVAAWLGYDAWTSPDTPD